MKRFWAFIKHNRKDYTGAPTFNSHGKHEASSKEKAIILNEQFESVLTEYEPDKTHAHYKTSVNPHTWKTSR